MIEGHALSSRLGMANHEGVGAGLSATAFDWPRARPNACGSQAGGFCLLFANAKVGRRRPSEMLNPKKSIINQISFHQ